jgi:hypothetical protein
LNGNARKQICLPRADDIQRRRIRRAGIQLFPSLRATAKSIASERLQRNDRLSEPFHFGLARLRLPLLAVGYSSDRKRERHWHVAGFVAAACFILRLAAGNVAMTVAA